MVLDMDNRFMAPQPIAFDPLKPCLPPNTQFNLKFLDHALTLETMTLHLEAVLSGIPTLEEALAKCRRVMLCYGDESHWMLQHWVSDMYHQIITSVVQISEHFLGTYKVSEARCRPTNHNDYLHRAGNGNAALRLYKRGLRNQATASSRITSRSAARSPEEDCLAYFQDLYRHRETMRPVRDALDPTTPERRELKAWFALTEDEMHSSIGPQGFLELDAIADALRTYPTAKAQGLDGLCPLILQRLDRSKVLSRALYTLYNLCVCSGQTPASWNEVLLISIPKAGQDTPTIDNRRPIAITHMLRRIFERVYLRYLSTGHPTVESALLGPSPSDVCDNQAGFRPNRSVFSHILALHEAMCWQPHDAIFLDFRSAYDSVDIERLLEKLRLQDQSFLFRNLVRSLYTGGCGRILVNGRITSDRFTRFSGVLQGGLWSPLLFNLFIDDLAQTIPVIPGALTLPILKFADDVTLNRPTSCWQQLDEDMRLVRLWCRENDLTLNVKKCGWIQGRGAARFFLPNLNDIPVVQEYKFLGVPMKRDGVDCAALLSRSLSNAQAAFTTAQLHSRLWPPSTRLSIYRAFVRSRLEFGAGLIQNFRPGSPALERVYLKAMTFEQGCIRWILGLHWRTRVSVTHRHILGLADFSQRMEDLSCMFARHLSNILAPGSNLALICDTLVNRAVTNPGSVLVRANRNPTFNRYKRRVNLFMAGQPWMSGNELILRPIVNSDGRVVNKPPTLAVALAIDRTCTERANSVMCSLVSPNCRTGRFAVGAAACLRIPIPIVRRHAIKWRLNTFGYKWTCPTCRKPLTRGCIADCNLLSDCHDIEPYWWRRHAQDRAAHLHNPFLRHSTAYSLLDTALNFGLWRLFGAALLHILRKCTIPAYHCSVHPVNTLESDLNLITATGEPRPVFALQDFPQFLPWWREPAVLEPP
jgi:hypothetical protein